MKIIAIKDMSDGNDSVGEMWKETKSFEECTPVIEIIRWAAGTDMYDNVRLLTKNLVLTTDENG